MRARFTKLRPVVAPRTATTGCGFAVCILQFALCCAGVVDRADARAASPGVTITGVRVGLDNRYKVGLWTQVEVTLESAGEAVEGELWVVVPDGDGVPSRVRTPGREPIRLVPGRPTTAPLLCRFGRVHGTLTAEFRAGGELVASRTFETAAEADGGHFLPGVESRRLIVTVGAEPLPIEEAGKRGGAEGEHRPVSAGIDDVERLPTHWLGYEGVDAVVLSASQPQIYRKLDVCRAQRLALEKWISMGGRLVFSAGARAEDAIGLDGPLRTFAPGHFEKTVSLRRTETGAIEYACGSRSPISTTAQTPLRAARLTDVQGRVEVAEGDLPLVVRTPRGFGQIVFVAVDLDAPPLSTWPDRTMLLASLLDMPSARAEESETSTALLHHGYDDLAGQLRSALDQFGGSQLVPFWLVAILIVVYLLLIGPGDYFFLRKAGGRMTWTWLTFPTIVAAACLVAYGLAGWLKGDQLKVRQIDLVDIDAASRQMRGTSWFNLFSPRMEVYRLSVEPRRPGGAAAEGARSWTAWMGLPGGALGGMDPRAAGPTTVADAYDFSTPLDAMIDVPIPVWSTRSFTARWCGPASTIPEAELTDDAEVLSGVVVNTFGFPLERCVLAYGSLAYDLGTIGPGESARIGPMSKRSELKTLLTGWRAVFEGSSDEVRGVTTPYDLASTDPAYILRVMMFYDQAGGLGYTRLRNDYQRFVDLDDLLAAGRAILVAQRPVEASAKPDGVAVLRDGRPLVGRNDGHATMYRFVLPVKRAERGRGPGDEGRGARNQSPS